MAIGTFLRVALHRDRILLPASIGGLAAMAALSSSATVGLYPDVASRVGAADLINGSAALVALYGRLYDPTSLGALAMVKMGGFGSVFVAMLAIVVVVRHTRADEESGRLELLAAGPVGRAAPLAAALAEVLVASVALAALTALGLWATGLPLAGSLAFGLAWGSVGVSFGAVAAVAAQLTSSARTATAISATVLAVTYLLRGLGDISDAAALAWLRWASPVGWALQVRPFAGDRLWVLAIPAAFAVAASALASSLSDRRDLGTGLIGAGSGPAGAAPALRGPFGLAWRLHRGSVVGWSVGFTLLGALVGSLAADVADYANNERARELFQQLGGQAALTDAYLSLELVVAGMVAAAFGVAAVLRLRTEEVELRAEPVLAGAVSRLRWAGGHVLIAVAGSAALVVLGGAAAAVAHAVRTGDLAVAPPVVGAALAQVPAVWVVVASAWAVVGVAPRWSTVAWGAFATFVVLAELGPLLGLPQWLIDLSPFGHAVGLPGGPVPVAALGALATVAAGLAVIGAVGLRRRDLG